MIYLFVYVLLALALAGAYVAYSSKLPALYMLVAVALIVAAAGVWTGGLYPSQADLCLNSTSEDSFYWNCTQEIGRAPDVYAVNGTCDNVTVSYHYDYCQADGNTSPESDGGAWTWIFILLAIILIGAGIVTFMGGDGGATTAATQSAD